MSSFGNQLQEKQKMSRSKDADRAGQSGLGSNMAERYGADEHEIGEGPVARMLEQQTARLPSDTWLWAAGASIAMSLYFQATDRKQRALFVGNWAPTFLLLGIYNKMVKLHGSE